MATHSHTIGETPQGIPSKDFITGGGGTQVLLGGRGPDTFAFDLNVLGGTTRILDFQAGEDVLQLKGTFSGATVSLFLDDQQNTLMRITPQTGGTSQEIVFEGVDLRGDLSEAEALRRLVGQGSLHIV